MRTFYGHEVDFEAFLRGEDISFDIRDIAHALSIEARFGGHTIEPVSVAAHSIRVYQRVVQLTADMSGARRLHRGALLHDASEAYLKDIPKELKRLLKSYHLYEMGCEDALSRCFDFPLNHSLIKEADMDVLILEWKRYRSDPPPSNLPTADGVSVDYWEPDAATVRADFLRLADQLGC